MRPVGFFDLLQFRAIDSLAFTHGRDHLEFDGSIVLFRNGLFRVVLLIDQASLLLILAPRDPAGDRDHQFATVLRRQCRVAST